MIFCFLKKGGDLREEIEKFRDGIFSLYTRRFGKMTELMIQQYKGLSGPDSNSYDLYDHDQDKKVEVKFCAAQQKHDASISDSNILEAIAGASINERMFAGDEWEDHQFDCNIQQVKPAEFDVLYYGIFFSDQIQIFKITSEEINENPSLISYSDKQHRGNVGEGQFHLNNDTYQVHLGHFLEDELTYSQLYELFSEL